MAANKRQLKPDQPLLILNLRAAYHATPAAALMTFLGAGDHLLVQANLNDGTYDFVTWPRMRSSNISSRR